MRYAEQLTRIRNECLFISSTFPKESYKEILDDSSLKRALIGSLHLIDRTMPKGVFRRNIKYSDSPHNLKNHLVRSIYNLDFKFKENELIHFLEVRIQEILKSVESLLGAP